MMSPPRTPLDAEEADEEMDIDQFEQNAAASHAAQPVEPETPPASGNAEFVISTPVDQRHEQSPSEMEELKRQVAQLSMRLDEVLKENVFMKNTLKKIEEASVPGAASVPPVAPGLPSPLLAPSSLLTPNAPFPFEQQLAAQSAQISRFLETVNQLKEKIVKAEQKSGAADQEPRGPDQLPPPPETSPPVQREGGEQQRGPDQLQQPGADAWANSREAAAAPAQAAQQAAQEVHSSESLLTAHCRALHYKDVEKPTKYSGSAEAWISWAKSFRKFLKRTNAQWPELLAKVEDLKGKQVTPPTKNNGPKKWDWA